MRSRDCEEDPTSSVIAVEQTQKCDGCWEDLSQGREGRTQKTKVRWAACCDVSGEQGARPGIRGSRTPRLGARQLTSSAQPSNMSPALESSRKMKGLPLRAALPATPFFCKHELQALVPEADARGGLPHS